MTNSMQTVKQRNGFESILDQTMRRFFDANLWEPEKSRTMGIVPVNARENENQYQLDVIAPGCRKEDFQISVTSTELTVSYSRPETGNEQNQTSGWQRNEYVLLPFTRSFTLDDSVNTSGISAQYQNGILQIVLPKSEQVKPRTVTIEVK